jgi:hypothetical protein
MIPPGPGPSESAKGKASSIAVWGPCAVAFLIYIGSLRFGFIYDDHSQIVANKQIQSWEYLPRLLTTDVWSQKTLDHVGYYYRPLFSLWLLIVHTIGGLSPSFWHLTSVALHTIATYVVFKLSFELLKNTIEASFSALLFAVHPIHIESVCWVSADNEILYSAFVLLALFFYARGLERDPQQLSINWPSVAFWTAALFSKETAIAVLPLFFFLAYRYQDISLNWSGRLRAALQRSAHFFLAAAFYFIVRWLVLGRLAPERSEHSWSQILCTGPSMVEFYFQKLLWPSRLSSFYMNEVLSGPTPRMWVTLAVILIGSGLAAWFAMKRSTLLGLGIGLFILPLGPVLFAMRIFRQGSLSHDRYLYLPSVGLCLLSGILAKYLSSGSRTRKTAVAVSGGVLLTLFAWLNLTQQWFYRNDEDFFLRATELFPSNAYAIDELGSFYLERKQLDRSLEQFFRSHQLAPDDENPTFALPKGLVSTVKCGTFLGAVITRQSSPAGPKGCCSAFSWAN